ncbi:MAG: hypothetical protein R2692_07900 [Microbacterium sp.]
MAFAYRALASFLILLGIARVAGLWSATPTWSSFLYYTVLSNVLCLVWMVWPAIVTVRDAEAKGWYGYSTPSARGEAAVMEATTVTILDLPVRARAGAVHAAGRVPAVHPHRQPRAHRRSYLPFAFIYSAAGGRSDGNTVPYPFMDASVHGVGGVIAWIVGLTVALVGVGYGYYGLDRLLARVGRRRAAAASRKA